MSKRRLPSEQAAPPEIRQHQVPTGERVGDRPLPAGVRRRESELADEVAGRRGEPADVSFKRHELTVEDIEMAGSSNGASTSTLAGEAVLNVPSPAEKVRNTAPAELKRRIEDPPIESRAARALRVAEATKTAEVTRTAEDEWSTVAATGNSVESNTIQQPLQTHRRLPPLAPGSLAQPPDIDGSGLSEYFSVTVTAVLILAFHVAIAVSLYFWLA